MAVMLAFKLSVCNTVFVVIADFVAQREEFVFCNLEERLKDQTCFVLWVTVSTS